MTSQDNKSHDVNQILNVPFFHQTHEFTCGAACVMMAMKYFDPALFLDENLEIDIWREANLVEDWATCGRGLAYSAAKRGYRSEIIASLDDIPFRDRIFEISPNADAGILEFFFRDLKKRALSMHVPELEGEVTLNLIRESILQDAVPIILTSSRFFHQDDCPHLVVVRGWNPRGYLIHDPFWDDTRDIPIGKGKMESMIGYGAGQILIKILSKPR